MRKSGAVTVKRDAGATGTGARRAAAAAGGMLRDYDQGQGPRPAGCGSCGTPTADGGAGVSATCG